MKQAIIFDLDGTLLNTLDDLYSSVNHALAQFNLPVRSKWEVRSYLGNGVRRLVEHALPEGCDPNLTEKVFNEFRTYYLEHSLDCTQPYEGIISMLKQCKTKGLKTAIVSNKLNLAVQDLHQRFFTDCIDVAIGETPDVKRKPAPDMVKKAIELLGCKHDEAVYVGDSEVDLATAHNASLPCIAVSWGFRDKDFLIEQGAKTIIDSPSELLNVII
ncbi:MAG: HAD family hydrolase [Bacteroidaceae bacterium]|nr:HAD family hydrolase [Bacteroidaceae bacterium]